MPTYPTQLAEITTALCSGRLELDVYVDALCDRIEALEPDVQALLPEPERRARLQREAGSLRQRYPAPAERPPLYGIPVGVKDIFRVDGFPTRAGSQLPSELFMGPEAASVSTLRAAGALILGKTVSTEFAYFEPGPTRNPVNLDHTPGGSSSGSAAAVAAGFCPLAVGTQTVGSVIRPAAYCGIVGYKPSYGRIPTSGVIPFSTSADHIGLFAQDVEGLDLAASLLCTGWERLASHGTALPVLGVPTGPYLAQASAEALAAFETQLARLAAAGYMIRHIPVFDDIAAITLRHQQLIFAEMAAVHADWFPRYQELYRPRTAGAIHDGQAVRPEEAAAGQASQQLLRRQLEAQMAETGVDLWITPAAIGPAPVGIERTGDPAMNLPWTHAGLPTLTLPAGFAADGLPLGLQCSARFMADERLIAWAAPLAESLALV
ncbi:MAG: amidase [Herpetosiphonaceae bacterium]|nr:amidase [Herpetosiphonaceae bacterium]